jgi:hypothetical protein
MSCNDPHLALEFPAISQVSTEMALFIENLVFRQDSILIRILSMICNFWLMNFCVFVFHLLMNAIDYLITFASELFPS